MGLQFGSTQVSFVMYVFLSSAAIGFVYKLFPDAFLYAAKPVKHTAPIKCAESLETYHCDWYHFTTKTVPDSDWMSQARYTVQKTAAQKFMEDVAAQPEILLQHGRMESMLTMLS